MELPKGWVIASWSDIVAIKHGQNQKNVEDPNGMYPIYGSGGQIGRATQYLCKAGSTVVGRKGTINRPFFTQTDFWNIDTAFGITPHDGIHPKYLYMFCNHFNFNTLDHSTGRPSLTQTNLYRIKMPLPPFAEQQRIVAKIDTLFSKLDKGVKMLKTIRYQLQTYRQAVLKWAFEGKLSCEWRKKYLTAATIEAELREVRLSVISDVVDGAETYINLDKDWIWVSLGDLFDVEVGATPSRKQPSYWEGDIWWVSSGEVKFNRIIATNEKITKLGLENSSTNAHPIGTVLLAMIGEGKTRGRAAILKIPAAHNQNTAAILVRQQHSSEFLYYYLQYNYQNTRRVGSGNNQKALNKERVKRLPFPYTSRREQDYIVNAIESRLSICEKLEAIIDENFVKADALRQSVLKKAFAGQLVPQDPTDEPANKLLERIKAQCQSAKARPKP